MTVRWPDRYGSDNAAGWANVIRDAIAGHSVLSVGSIAQPAGNLVAYEFEQDGTSLRCALDYDDLVDLHPEAGSFDVYFKMQYQRGGYGLSAVRPGGYVSKHSSLYRLAHRWRMLRKRRCARRVYARFGTRFNTVEREEILRELEQQQWFEFLGGKARHRWPEYMREMAQSAICLDVAGRGPFCYRLIEAMAVGSCVVGPPLLAELPLPIEGRIEIARGDLVHSCRRLIERFDLVETAGEMAASYFDRALTPRQLGAYYVRTCFDIATGDRTLMPRPALGSAPEP